MFLLIFYDECWTDKESTNCSGSSTTTPTPKFQLWAFGWTLFPTDSWSGAPSGISRAGVQLWDASRMWHGKYSKYSRSALCRTIERYNKARLWQRNRNSYPKHISAWHTLHLAWLICWWMSCAGPVDDAGVSMPPVKAITDRWRQPSSASVPSMPCQRVVA